MESRHFDRDGRCWLFPREESKGKKESRIVHLNNRAFEICQRLALKYPDGPLFRNRKGNRWTHNGFDNRCKRVALRLGFHVTPYRCSPHLRHGCHP